MPAARVPCNYFSFMECSPPTLHSQGSIWGIARRDRVLFVVHSRQIAYHKSRRC